MPYQKGATIPLASIQSERSESRRAVLQDRRNGHSISLRFRLAHSENETPPRGRRSRRFGRPAIDPLAVQVPRIWFDGGNRGLAFCSASPGVPGGSKGDAGGPAAHATQQRLLRSHEAEGISTNCWGRLRSELW